MNEDQRKCYASIRTMCHDELRNCTNISHVIGIMFPDGDDNISLAMREGFKRYFDVRGELGGSMMEVIYELEKEGL